MSIYERIDGTLKILSVPFFDTMPEFAENSEPPLYIVYSLYDTPKLWGDGRLISTEYIVTVNVIGINAKEVDELQMSLLSLMQDYEFSYAGCNYQIDSDCPKQYRRIMDFKYVIESEEE